MTYSDPFNLAPVIGLCALVVGVLWIGVGRAAMKRANGDQVFSFLGLAAYATGGTILIGMWILFG